MGRMRRQVVFVLAFIVSLAALAQETSPIRHQFRLSFRAEGFLLVTLVPVGNQEVVFRKTPDFSGHVVESGMLPTGATPEQLTALAWDETTRVLYLDANRNLDLTDDAPLYGNTSVLMSFSGSVSVPHRAEFLLVRGVPGEEDCLSCNVRSGWFGDAVLDGQSLCVGVADNGDGALDGEDVLVLESAPYELSEKDRNGPGWIPFPKQLYFRGRQYTTEYAFEKTGETVELVLTFVETTASMGEMRLEGQYVSNLILRTGEGKDCCVALFENLPSVVTLPVGTYIWQKVYVGASGDNRIFFSEVKQPIEIQEGQTAVFRAGAPLVPHASVQRTGRNMLFDFTLVGNADETYLPVVTSKLGASYAKQLCTAPNLKPHLAVCQNDKQLAVVNFEYG